ncbi:hypothetical protein ACFXAW_02275 [Streptomyces sp. NPDC059445]|uniref:hypothetical protein n=1 Tax=Streptomyces sp. NPDC059445 TaxID=3346832 RepID=UPI0036B10338
MQQWPEGRAAESEAAREGYESDMRAVRAEMREATRADMPAAHFGVGVVLATGVVLGLSTHPVFGGLLVGGFCALFLTTLAVMFVRGVRGVDACRRSYRFTFGWANWI